MTVATDIDSGGPQHIVLEDVSWGFYEHLLEEIGNGKTRVTFRDGRLEIMSPLPKHEYWGRRIGSLVTMLCAEMNIPMVPLGSTTFRDEAKRIGLEPDECFYLEHWEAVHQIKGPFDPTIHPPPDLAIEIDITRRSIAKQPIYAALGVPELWRFDGKHLQIMLLGADANYHTKTASAAFAFLPIAEFERFLHRYEKENDTAVVRAFQQWARTLHK